MELRALGIAGSFLKNAPIPLKFGSQDPLTSAPMRLASISPSIDPSGPRSPKWSLPSLPPRGWLPCLRQHLRPRDRRSSISFQRRCVQEIQFQVGVAPFLGRCAYHAAGIFQCFRYGQIQRGIQHIPHEPGINRSAVFLTQQPIRVLFCQLRSWMHDERRQPQSRDQPFPAISSASGFTPLGNSGLKVNQSPICDSKPSSICTSWIGSVSCCSRIVFKFACTSFSDRCV